MNNDKTTDLIEHHEGLRLWAYKDSRGIWTIGIGFNLQRQGAAAALAKHGIDFNTIWNACKNTAYVDHGGVTRTAAALITEDQARALVGDDIEASIADLHTFVPTFDAMPDDAQMILVDLHFNMGGAELRTWHHTLGYFEAGNWAAAAHEISVSAPWCHEVPVRCAEDVAIVAAIQ